MSKLRNMVKHFANPASRKNCDLVFQEHRNLPINSIKRDLNGTRIRASFNLVRSCLMLKKAMKFFCDKCEVLSFSTQEEWKSSGEIETALHETYKLTTFFQNKEKWNSAFGKVVRNTAHEGLSYGSMNVIDAEDWSNNKSIMHPTRPEINTDTYTTVEKTLCNKALLETEWRFLESLKRKLSQNLVKIVT